MKPLEKVIKYFAVAFAVMLAVGIIGGIVTAVGAVVVGVSGEASGDNFFESLGGNTETISFTKEFSEVKSLSVDAFPGTVRIVTGDTFRVTAENVPSDCVAEVRDGVLRVERERGIQVFTFFSWSGDEARITIELPADFKAERATLENGSGKLEVEGLCAEKLYVDTGSGMTSLKNIQVTELELDSGSGIVLIEGRIAGNASFDTGSGHVEVCLYGKREDYRISCDTGSGGFWVDGKRMEDGKSGSGENKLSFDTGSGRVTLDFKEQYD